MFFVILGCVKRISKKQIDILKHDLWVYYDVCGRHDLPWRKNPSPYRVVVSEIMLQQTQVVRVEEYFRDWMKKYPTWRALSRASLREVLLSWQGLGYNRRGKYLHDIATIVTEQYKGTLPQTREELQFLPGIGHYTAGSIRAFAFNQLDVFLETNIRTVLFHHFYNEKIAIKEIPDQELLTLLKKYLAHDRRAQKNPREFYYALMDYGSHLKQTVGNLNQKSKSYNKQSRFEGSRRQLRAQVLRYVLHNGPVSEKKILEQSNRDHETVKEILEDLVKEKSISRKGKQYNV